MLEITLLVLYVLSVLICVPLSIYYWAIFFNGATIMDIMVNILAGSLPVVNFLWLHANWKDVRGHREPKKYFTNIGKK